MRRLRSSYEAIPAGAPVRLAKPTSNLFRARAATTSPGLDVSGLTGVLGVDPEARTADVQGMCTYEDLVDATLPHGLIPLVVPQLKTITLGGAVTGLGHRVDVASATGCRTSRCSRWTSSPAPARSSPPARTSTPTCSTPSRTPTARSATRPGCGSSWSRCRRYVALRHVRFTDAAALAATRSTEIVDTGGHDGEPGRLPRRRRVRARRELPDARHAGPTEPRGRLSDYTGQHDLLPVASSSREHATG